MGNHSRGGCVCQTLSLASFYPRADWPRPPCLARCPSRWVVVVHRGNLGGRRRRRITILGHDPAPTCVQGRSIGSPIYPFLRYQERYPGSRAQKKTKPRNRWPSPGFGPNKVGQHPKSGRRRDDDGMVSRSAATAMENAHTGLYPSRCSSSDASPISRGAGVDGIR